MPAHAKRLMCNSQLQHFTQHGFCLCESVSFKDTVQEATSPNTQKANVPVRRLPALLRVWQLTCTSGFLPSVSFKRQSGPVKSPELLFRGCLLCQEGITSLAIHRFSQPPSCLDSSGRILLPFIYAKHCWLCIQRAVSIFKE